MINKLISEMTVFMNNHNKTKRDFFINHDLLFYGLVLLVMFILVEYNYIFNNKIKFSCNDTFLLCIDIGLSHWSN
jgi:hypothetical protein